jgi:hypothetical protein
MRKILAIVLITIINFSAAAQSKVTEELGEKYASRIFFFYNNTLRMINQQEDKELDELIKDIEKMKLVWIDKKAKNFGAQQYKKLIGDYKSEAFEEIMTSRFQGKSFDVYLKEKDGKTKGMVVTVDDSESVYVLDIVGSIALDKITKFFSKLDESSDVGRRIKNTFNKNREDDKDKKADQ